MKFPGALAAASLLAAATLLAGCGDRAPAGSGNPTAVLGGSASAPRAAAKPAPLTDAQGRVIPPPQLPPRTSAQMVRAGAEAALALWVQDGRTVAASYAPASGWSAPVPLEEIHGQASEPQLAGNGEGAALAVWRHTVGSIQSLRFSRFDIASGWSVPDVMPGALPRPPGAAGAGAPQLQMDAQGNAFAQWPSGFAADEVQTARYVAGQGWTRALSEPVTASAEGQRRVH